MSVLFDSTIGEMLAKETNCSFIDADDYHPQSNKGKYVAQFSMLGIFLVSIYSKFYFL